MKLLQDVKVVLHRYPRCPNSHDLSECHHSYSLGRHILRPLMAAKNHRPPISITVSNMTPKNYPK